MNSLGLEVVRLNSKRRGKVNRGMSTGKGIKK